MATALAKAGVVHSEWEFLLARFVSRDKILQAGEYRFDGSAVAEQQIFNVGMTGERNVGARQNDCRAMVAAHGIKRNANLIRHGSLVTALIGAPAAWSY